MAGYYDYNGLIAEYLSQSKESSSTAKGRLSFRGHKLYSYNSLLAKLNLSNRIVYIDKHIANYSITSAKHTSRLIHQANAIKLYIYKLNLDLSNNEVLDEYIDDVYATVEKLFRARTKQSIYKQKVHSTLDTIEQFKSDHTIDKRKKPYKRLIKLIQYLFKYKLLKG